VSEVFPREIDENLMVKKGVRVKGVESAIVSSHSTKRMRLQYTHNSPPPVCSFEGECHLYNRITTSPIFTISPSGWCGNVTSLKRST